MADTVKDYKKSDQCAAASLLNALISWVNKDHEDTLTISHNQGCYIRDEIERLRKAEQENVALRAELEAKLAALDWTPITESNLPKRGYEVLRQRTDVSGRPNITIDAVIFADEIDYAEWCSLKYTHFRPINPPVQPQKDGE